MQLLHSLKTVKVLSQLEIDQFMSTLFTVASSLSTDLATLNIEDFLKKYGHLRPGTYEITTPRYDSEPERYFYKSAKNTTEARNVTFELSSFHIDQISQLLKGNGLNVDVKDLFRFFKFAIEQREYSKFEFTKNISMALELIIQLGQQYGLKPEELSYLDIFDVLNLHNNLDSDVESALNKSIELGKLKFESNVPVILPDIILSKNDFFGFSFPEYKPNYVTNFVVMAEACSTFEKDQIRSKNCVYRKRRSWI